MAGRDDDPLNGNTCFISTIFDIPKPGHGQVLIKTMASTICGSDIRCIYREHTGKGAEGYIPGTVAGHEPCGYIVEEGEGLKRFKKGDRVIVYHISGCDVCYDCRRGYAISCTSPYRQAYGWQRNGGMAPYILAEEKDLIPLPDELTYCDGAQVACGFGTTYEALEKTVRWGIHPDKLITHRFPLDKAGEAYALMASGKCGEVAVVFDEKK